MATPGNPASPPTYHQLGSAAVAEAKRKYLQSPVQAHHSQVAELATDLADMLDSIDDIAVTVWHTQDNLRDDAMFLNESALRPVLDTLQQVVSGMDSCLKTIHPDLLGTGGTLLSQMQVLLRSDLELEGFDVAFYKEEMRKTHERLVQLYDEMQQLIQLLEASRGILEGARLRPLHAKCVKRLRLWTDELQLDLSMTGRIRAMRMGLAAVARAKKTLWEDEMLLTKLVPVS